MRKNLIKKAVSMSIVTMIISLLIVPAFNVKAADTKGAVKKLSTTEVMEKTSEETEEETDEETTEEAEAFDFEADLKGLSDEEAVEKLYELTDQSLKEYCKGEYKLSKEDNIVFIDLCYDGMAMVADKAKEDASYKPNWDMVMESIRQLSEVIHNEYKDYGMYVCINLLDDTNHDNTLLATVNDKVYYDYVAGKYYEEVWDE